MPCTAQRLDRAFLIYPNISDFGVFFPEDLRGMIAGLAMDGVCCSVVRPGDIFHGPQANSFGSIGVVVDLQSAQSLRAVTVGDGGARVVDGKREFNEVPFNLGKLRDSLKRPADTHNEWGVRDYIVRGLFVADRVEVTVAAERAATLPVTEVRTLLFPEQRIYSFTQDRIVELPPRGNAILIEHSEIYKK